MAKKRKKRRQSFTANKSVAQKEHFKKQFLSRYGISLNRHDIKELNSKINTGEYISKLSQTTRVKVYDMVFKGIRCNIIYDEKRKVPVTVITPDMKKEKGGIVLER